MTNNDRRVIEAFGNEWSRFRYSHIDAEKLGENFDQYFKIFPWERVSASSEGFDMGCGSGRWAKFVAPKVGILNCVEPSEAIVVARENLSCSDNVRFFQETTETCSLASESQDFGYSLGVLHHIPNTQKAIEDCARLLKPGAPFLIYLYYNFDNKPFWYAVIWRFSDFFRKSISRLPHRLKILACELIAAVVYFPLARLALGLEKFGISVINFPLSDYRSKPFYQMRNDSLDRFGTRLEHRFSKNEIKEMLEKSSFEDITFSNGVPFWCCVGYKKR